MKLHNKIKIGYEISLEKGSLKPTKMTFWKDEKSFKNSPLSAPLKYMADAMLGLSMIRLNHFVKSPVHTPHMNYSFAHDAWQTLDPHHELYSRSQPRVIALQSKNSHPLTSLKDFEKAFLNALHEAQRPWGMDFSALWPMLDMIADLETQLKKPLLFNFNVQFSKIFTDKMHELYSFLFNLRSLVAVDFNAHVEDASHEAVKVDAITDYLPKAEYVVNDALLYWNFIKTTQPFAGPHHSDSQIEKLLVNPLIKTFHKYSHNACQLIDNLPKSFLNSMNPAELEEALYLVQMDWLLGSEAGLLFRIREELFGLQNGYEHIFWNEIEPKNHKKAVVLSVCCELHEKHVFANQAA